MSESSLYNKPSPDLEADREKRRAAVTSVIAAIGLTLLKIAAGIATGSLGILAEAAHSGLDLAAAVITYVAIRIAVRPADSGHNYGHGKVENLSALFETLLLLATCGWIMYEAINRLFFRSIEVEASIWAFGVMVISIMVDWSRSRVLKRAAKAHRSQALEADALHFSTDIWSSAVVILGLACVKAAEYFPGYTFLSHADAAAAIIVAMIVAYVSIRLAIRAVQALIDAAPRGHYRLIKETAEGIPGVINCHQIRFRSSGPKLFIDIHIMTDGTQTLAQAHEITDNVERAIQDVVPNADVTVHPEPDSGKS